MKSTESLLEAYISKEAIQEHYKKVIALKIDKLFKLSKDSEEIDIISYEKLTTLDIKKTAKNGLSIGSFELSQEVIIDYSYDKL